MSQSFVLITAAKNEQNYITYAMESVLRQSIRPRAWFIVDDGSTDQTAQIVKRFASTNRFIHLLFTNRSDLRNFGSKDMAIAMAYERARPLNFEFLGIQDADIGLQQQDYYERLLNHFNASPTLGIAGGYIFERQSGRWSPRKANSPDSVAGGIQTFRRSCYEQIGGYTPLHLGGEDWLAQLKAQMAGWDVAAYPDMPVYHYRPTSSADGRWRGLFRLGMMDASFGSHPIFQLLKCARRVPDRPLVLGGIVRLGGYLWWRLSGRDPLLDAITVNYLRTQQINKVRRWMIT